MPSPTSRRRFLTHSILAATSTSWLGLNGMPVQGAAPFQRGLGARMKLSCAAYSYRKYLQEQKPPTMTIEDFLVECAKMGLDAAEPTAYYFPSPLTDEFLRKFKRKAFLLGLEISGTAIGNTFTYPPGPKRDENLRMVKEWIDRAVIFGAPCIRVFAGNASDAGTLEQARRNCIETMETACAYAAERGVFLALENHGGIVSDAEGVLAILKEVKSDWFGVNLDTGNFQTDDPYLDMAKVAPYAVTVQIKIDVQPKGGKAVDADFERIIGILGEAGYRGYLALEYEGREEPKEAIPRVIEKLQKILKKIF